MLSVFVLPLARSYLHGFLMYCFALLSGLLNPSQLLLGIPLNPERVSNVRFNFLFSEVPGRILRLWPLLLDARSIPRILFFRNLFLHELLNS